MIDARDASRADATALAWPGWDADGRDAEGLLWTDASVLRAPAAATASALALLHDALASGRVRTTAEAAFLVQLPSLAATPAFAEVASHPRAYHWARTALELAGTGADFDRHLDGFGAFEVAAGLAAGGERRLARPLAARLPFAIPTTRWSLRGDGAVEVHGVRERRVLVAAGGRRSEVPLDDVGAPQEGTAGAVVAASCPVARHAGFELPLDPQAFDVAGVDVAAAALAAGPDYQARQVALVEATLACVAVHAPDAFARLRQMIRMAAMKPADAGGFDDVSPEPLPGSFVASVVPNPLVLGDHFVHELQHNRLACVEESGSLFAGDGGAARCYSPWRNEPRGFHGLFHGVYVFVAVARYWLGALADAGLDAGDRAYALDRLSRLPAQLAIAVDVLERHTCLSALGARLLARLVRDVADVAARVARLGLPADAPALRVAADGSYVPETDGGGRSLAARAAVVHHARTYDRLGQSAGLVRTDPGRVAVR